MRFSKTFFLLIFLIVPMLILSAQSDNISITPIATHLNNPRGMMTLPDGRLMLAEAGTGESQRSDETGTGQIIVLDDVNNDGDYDDPDERNVIVGEMVSYNSLPLFGTFHDEVFGVGDIVQLPDGRIFFTQDDPFAIPVRNLGEELYKGNTGIFQMIVTEANTAVTRQLIKRPATMNAIGYDANIDMLYAVESGFNQLIAVDLDGQERIVAEFEPLASGQQAVPAGLAIDPRNGDVLVALFSGFVRDYYGDTLSFMPGDAKVVRVDPDTGTVTDEITGLTTAIDVTIDADGNVFVAELTITWATPFMPRDFALYDPEQPPDPGGYVRNSGRVTMYPANGSDPIILMSEVDTPTNLTIDGNTLYVSTGLGTPGRNVSTSTGIQQITGVLYRITGF